MPEVKITFCEETAFGLGWLASEPALLQRASHALAADDRVWLIDAVDGPGLDERIRALGDPAGVVQLLDRHPRDCAVLAERLGVPHLRLPFNGVPGAPFEVRVVLSLPGWRELALWWEAERVLVCVEALGTASYFRAPGEQLAVHPAFRLYRPRGLRDMATCLAPRHVLVGHGEGIHGDGAAAELVSAVAGARRGLPRWLRHQLRRRKTR